MSVIFENRDRIYKLLESGVIRKLQIVLENNEVIEYRKEIPYSKMLVYFEAQDRKTFVQYFNSNRIENIGYTAFMELDKSLNLIEVNRGLCVNIEALISMDEIYVYLRNGHKLQYSRRRKKEIKETLNNYHRYF